MVHFRPKDDFSRKVEMTNQNENDVREQIIDAATRLYAKYGLKKTTMEDIAAEAGKGKATLYYYFKSKYDVFSSVIDQQTREVKVKLNQVLSGIDSAPAMLAIYVSTMIETAKEKVSIFSFLQMDIREDPRLIEEIRGRFRDNDTSHLRRIIEAGIKQQQFRTMDDAEIESVADAISTALNGITIRFMGMPEDQPLTPERVESITRFFINGLKA